MTMFIAYSLIIVYFICSLIEIFSTPVLTGIFFRSILWEWRTPVTIFDDEYKGLIPVVEVDKDVYVIYSSNGVNVATRDVHSTTLDYLVFIGAFKSDCTFMFPTWIMLRVADMIYGRRLREAQQLIDL